MSDLVVALAGNPNTGKTTLFNRMTGARGRVGNYPGVTVELSEGRLDLAEDRKGSLVDVPGTYSLVARSAEEQVAIRRLLGLDGEPAPQVVVFCVDATNLARNLYIVLQAQELGLNTVVALTMVDECGDQAPDAAKLSEQLACPVVPVVARTGQGIEELKAQVLQAAAAPTDTRWRWQPSDSLRQKLQATRQALPDDWPGSDGLSLWCLMSVDDSGDDLQGVSEGLRDAVKQAVPDEQCGAGIDEEAACARYRWLDEHVSPLVEQSIARSWTQRADRVLIHPVWGFAVFIALMAVLFQSLFAWSDPAIGLVESLFGWLSTSAAEALGPGVFSSLVADGIIAGVGGVVVFLPQILLLFFLIGLMEDSGYMARVAYLMDRIMQTMGLHGRAFVPMLSGFACAVPAVLATRTMERQRDRILTMMVVPLMSCSARLPVYTLLIGALFPVGQLWGFIPVQGGLMIAMYLFSTVTALFAAWVLSKTVLPAPATALVLELPPYRLPRLVDVLRMMGSRTYAFLSEAGTVILACTIVLWALLSFPQQPGLSEGQQLRQSYGGQLGHAIEPVIEPLGFDWKIGVGLIGAFAAREVFVSTMGVVYNVGAEVDEEDATLRERLRNEVRADGRPVYSPLVGLSLMVFFALACQCMSTLAVVKRETHGYRWPVFLFVYMTSLAWLSSLLIYQGGRWLGLA